MAVATGGAGRTRGGRHVSRARYGAVSIGAATSRSKKKGPVITSVHRPKPLIAPVCDLQADVQPPIAQRSASYDAFRSAARGQLSRSSRSYARDTILRFERGGKGKVSTENVCRLSSIDLGWKEKNRDGIGSGTQVYKPGRSFLLRIANGVDPELQREDNSPR